MEKVDCLILGYYQQDLKEIVGAFSDKERQSAVYRYLNLSFVEEQNSIYSITGLVNKYNCENTGRNLINLNDTLHNAIPYLCTYLNRRGLTYEYINSVNEEKDVLIRMLQEKEILTVAITTTLYVTPEPIIEIIELVRKYNKSVKLVLGGPFVSTYIKIRSDEEIDYMFNNLLDIDFYVNSSQGESTLVRLIKSLKGNEPIQNVPNLYYKSGGEIVKTEKVVEDNKLQDNMIDWSLFSAGKKKLNLRTTISCPFTCAFCGFPENAGAHQVVEVDRMKQEMDAILKYHDSVRNFYFIDDTFNVPKKRFKDFLKMLIENDYKIRWHSYLRCQFIDEEVVELMKLSGCEGVFLGIESASEAVLKNMNKRAHAEDYRKGIKLLKENGIVTFGSFIIGFPGETIQTVKETIRFIEESGLDYYRAQLWFYEHITPIWRQREQYNLVGEGYEWEHATMNSRTGISLVEKIFMSTKNAVWLPQEECDFVGLWDLVHAGFSTQEVRELLRSFSEIMRLELLKKDHGKAELFDKIKVLHKSAIQRNAVNKAMPLAEL